MTTAELIAKLQELDPEGMTPVFVGGESPYCIQRLPFYYDGTPTLLIEDPAKKPYYSIGGAEILSRGDKVVIGTTGLLDILIDHPEIPITARPGHPQARRRGAGVGAAGECRRGRRRPRELHRVRQAVELGPMKPSAKRLALAYLSGVIVGDGWLTDRELGLTCKDRDFAQAFARATAAAFGVAYCEPKAALRDTGVFWSAHRSNKGGHYNALRTFTPRGDAENAQWLRGMFDSEGCAYFAKHRAGPHCYFRRVTYYSTNKTTIRRVTQYLARFKLPVIVSRRDSSPGHLGNKPVYELRLRAGRDRFFRFGLTIGSSIARKAWALLGMVLSYRQDVGAYCRAAQLKGAETKVLRTEREVLPIVAAQMHDRWLAGLPVTTTACSRDVVGYPTVLKHLEHSELLAVAGAA